MSRHSLDHSFRLIAFDWDGTAVTSRFEDVSPLRHALESLLHLGVWIVVITGTNFANIDRQFSAAVVGPHKQRLFVCTNRGSEVFGFDAQSQPVLLWERVATHRENQLLTEVAEGVRDTLQAGTGLDVRVIANRLNRRKIDLIPEWPDPPKSALGTLLATVDERLKTAGIKGGLREVLDRTAQLAVDKGLGDARITTDIKHVEVGLTDKSDSIRWMLANVAAKNNIPAQDILIGGDEFGPIAGFEGSDYRMVTVAPPGTVFVSVGPEPSGLPDNVIHLGGGPVRFLEVLEKQIRLHQEAATKGEGQSRPDPAGTVRPAETVNTHSPEDSPREVKESQGREPDDQDWVLIEEGFSPAREHEIESLFTVSNGYVGTRGSLQEWASVSQPATLVAGSFVAPRDSPPQLLLGPDWSKFRVFVDGAELRLDTGQTLEHRRVLDLRRGVLSRMWRHKDHLGRITTLRFRRFASLADRHALVEWVTVAPENYGGRLRIESLVDSTFVVREGVSDVQTKLAALTPKERSSTASGGEPAGTVILIIQRSSSGEEIAYAVASLPHALEQRATVAAHVVVSDREVVGDAWEWDAEIGMSYRVDKFLSVHSSRDAPDPGSSATEHLARLVERGANELLADNSRAWADRWALADVRIPGNSAAQRAIRFAIYHLIAADPRDEYISIGARGLTGEAYKGHVFWETEIYMLPFYVFTHPSSARSLLMYRYHTLPYARKKAEQLGYRGALYPWESTNTGEEATPSFALGPNGEVIPILAGQQEHHISADVAYAVWQYWRNTGDDDFYLNAGAEIVIETARFWVSRVKWGKDGHFHIRHVIGPDEYHEDVDDDAYTNGMARWNLERGAETVRLLRTRWPEHWQDLSSRLGLGEDELKEWVRIAARMYTGFDPDTGLIEQFRGYFNLEYVDLGAFEPRTAPMDVLLGHEGIARTQIIKQPDVVMLIYLLWDQFPPEVRDANFRYYEPRCGQSSSLSPSIHAAVAARLGLQELAERFFQQAADIDLANNMGNAAGGVHLGAQGGLWQAAIFGFAGMRPQENGLVLDPHLPADWESMSFHVVWRGRQLCITGTASPPSLEMVLEHGRPMPIAVGAEEGKQTELLPGVPLRVSMVEGSWGMWQEASP